MFECTTCGFQTEVEKKLQEHERVKHFGQKYKCKLCDFEAETKDIVYYHKSQIHDQKKSECGLCHKIFKKRVSFKRSCFYGPHWSQNPLR